MNFAIFVALNIELAGGKPLFRDNAVITFNQGSSFECRED